MEFWKLDLTWKLKCPIQQNKPKKQKETTKEGGISSTIMDQKSIYNSKHKPQRSPNETLGFNMVIINIECAMKQEFLNSWNPKF